MNVAEFMTVRAERALQVQLLGVRFNMQPHCYREHVLKYYESIHAGASKAEIEGSITKCIKEWIEKGGKFLMGEKILNANDDVIFNVIFNGVSCHFLLHGPLLNYASKPVSKHLSSLFLYPVDKTSPGARPENCDRNTPYTDLMETTRTTPTKAGTFLSSIISGIADRITRGTSIGQSNLEQTAMADTNTAAIPVLNNAQLEKNKETSNASEKDASTAGTTTNKITSATAAPIVPSTKADQPATKEIPDQRQVAAVPVQTTTAGNTTATIPTGNKEKSDAASTKEGSSTAATADNNITSATAPPVAPNTNEIPNAQKPSEASANGNPTTADARARASYQNPNGNSNAMVSAPSTAFVPTQAYIQRPHFYSQPLNERFVQYPYPPGNAVAMPMPMHTQFATLSPQFQYRHPYSNQQMQMQQQLLIQQQRNAQQMHNFNNFHQNGTCGQNPVAAHNRNRNHVHPVRTPPKPPAAIQYPSPGDMTVAVQLACKKTASQLKENSKSSVKKRSLQESLGDGDFHDPYHSTKQRHRHSSPIVISVAEIQIEVEKRLQMFKKPWGGKKNRTRMEQRLRDEKARSIIDHLTTRDILRISSSSITWAA